MSLRCAGKPKPRQKYIDLYAAHGRVFAVVQDTLSTLELLLPPLRRSAARRTLGKLHVAGAAYRDAHGEGAEPAVVVHMMSNNGALSYLSLRREMAHSSRPADAWVRRRLAGTVLDSTPGQLTFGTFAGAFWANKPSQAVQAGIGAAALLWAAVVVRVLGLAGFATCVAASAAAGRAAEMALTQRYTSRVARDSFLGPQLFLFSKRDALVGHETVRSVVRRREKRGADVTAVEFSDSAHVGHLRMHADEYTEAVGQLLDGVDGESTA